MGAFFSKLLGSRKFTVAIAGFCIAIFKDKLGINVSEDLVMMALGLLAVAVGGEAYRDGKAAESGSPQPSKK